MTTHTTRRHFISMARLAHRKAMNERKAGNIGQSFALFNERDVQLARSRGLNQ